MKTKTVELLTIAAAILTAGSMQDAGALGKHHMPAEKAVKLAREILVEAAKVADAKIEG